MKIKDLKRDVLLEFSTGYNIEDHPNYDPDEERDYIARTIDEHRVEDPLEPGTDLLTLQDRLTLASLAYSGLVQEKPPAAILAEVNEFRELFYKARLAVKYPHDTAGDPSYAEALQNMLEIYHIMDPDYDPIDDTDIGRRS